MQLRLVNIVVLLLSLHAAYRLYSRYVCDDSVVEDDCFITIRYTKSHFYFTYYYYYYY